MNRLTRVLLERCLPIALALAACGPDARPRAADPRDLRTLSEGRAIEVIRQVAAEAGVTTRSDWPVVLGGRDPISVDERIGTTSFGLEFVNPQDRADHGDVFPEPRDDGQLLLIEGRGQDQSARVLVLDHRNYRYDPDLERVQRGATGVREAEARLRRDVRDFLEHVRAEGAL
jgi:hypothetical protein